MSTFGLQIEILGLLMTALHPRLRTIVPACLRFPSTIHSSIQAFAQVRNHLRTRSCPHVAPGFIDSTGCDCVTYGSRLSHHGNIGVWEEILLGKVGSPGLILQARQGTAHFILSYHYSVQRNAQFLTGSYRPMNDKSCKLKHLQQNIKLFTKHNIRTLYIISHKIYFEQMLARTKTSLQRAKRKDVSYFTATPR